MAIAVWILIIIVVFLVGHSIFIQMQLRNFNRQLEKRLFQKTREAVNLSLLNKELNRLAANINRCLKAEELIRVENIRNEKRFREMIADISHDLRTPLTAVKGYQQLLGKEGLTEDQQRKLWTAQKHANELEDLVERFFEYAYLISMEPEITLERINMTHIVTECIVDSIPLLEEKNMSIQFEEAPAVFIMADRKMLIRIIQNLIRNCTAYADGSINVEILLQQKAVLLFRNRINKTAEMKASQLFDRYYTGNNAKGKGTGLGLSIVKLLAEQLGGNANVSMQDGVFEIRVEFLV